MIDFLDDNGEWHFDKMVADVACAAQIIREEVLTWYGEIFTDTQRGVKWYKYINAVEINDDVKQEIKADIQKAIYRTNLVKQITQLDIEKNNNQLIINYQVVLVDDNQEVEGKIAL